MNRTTARNNLTLLCLLAAWTFTAAPAFSIASTSSDVSIEFEPSVGQSINAGTNWQVQCSAIARSLSPKLSLYQRTRSGRNDLVSSVQPPELVVERQGTSSKVKHRFELELEPVHNGVEFYCQLTDGLLTSTTSQSNKVKVNVTFPPTGVKVFAQNSNRNHSSSSISVAEASRQEFVCQLEAPGSNPPSELKWTQLDSLGGKVGLDDVQVEPVHQLGDRESGGFIAKSRVIVAAERTINGRRFECSVEYQNRHMPSLRAEGLLEVEFAPNNVQLTANPMNGVREADRLELICSTSSCHPPAVIRWFELPADAVYQSPRSNTGGKENRRQLTDLAAVEAQPGDFGGTKIVSTLIVTNTYRSNQHTKYLCSVEHPAMKKPIVNEHRLQVIYPPNIDLSSLPSKPKLGESVSLQCATSGGYPTSDRTYSWYVASGGQLKAISSHSMSEGDSDHGTFGESNTPRLDEMTRLRGLWTNRLNLSSTQLAHRGWYACQVEGQADEVHAMYYLDFLYQPILLIDDLETNIKASVGQPAQFIARLDANPPDFDVDWLQVGVANRHQNNQDKSSSDPNRESSINTRVGLPGDSSRDNIVARADVADRNGAGGNRSRTFILDFLHVRPGDFGNYVCRVRHQLGVEEFAFKLSENRAGFSGNRDQLTPVKISQQGKTTLINFRPLHINELDASGQSTAPARLVLRVCRRDAVTHPHAAYQRPEVSSSQRSRLQRQAGCEDYQVNRPESGRTELYLSKAVQLYNFRLVLFRGSDLVQETDPVVWQPEVDAEALDGGGSGTSIVAIAVSVGCVILVLVLLACCAVAICCSRRSSKHRWRSSKEKKYYNHQAPSDRQSTVTSGNETDQMPPGRNGGTVSYELRSDLGSVRSYQPGDMDNIALLPRSLRLSANQLRSHYDASSPPSISSSHQRAVTGSHSHLLRLGTNSPQGLHLRGMASPTPSDFYPLVDTNGAVYVDRGGSSASADPRMLSDAYMAAAQAASAAVASVVKAAAGSTKSPTSNDEGVDDQGPYSQMTSVDELANSMSSLGGDTNQSITTPPGSTTGGPPTSGNKKKDNNLQSGGQHYLQVRRNSAQPTGIEQRQKSLVHLGTRRLQNSGNARQPSSSISSYSSLHLAANSASQQALEVAAQAAAAAAVASVMRSMQHSGAGSSLSLLNANSSGGPQQHVDPRLSSPQQRLAMPPRSASRAASMSSGGQQHGSQLALLRIADPSSGDGESLNYAVFGSTGNGQLTPTASLNHFDFSPIGSNTHLGSVNYSSQQHLLASTPPPPPMLIGRSGVPSSTVGVSVPRTNSNTKRHDDRSKGGGRSGKGRAPGPVYTVGPAPPHYLHQIPSPPLHVLDQQSANGLFAYRLQSGPPMDPTQFQGAGSGYLPTHLPPLSSPIGNSNSAGVVRSNQQHRPQRTSTTTTESSESDGQHSMSSNLDDSRSCSQGSEESRGVGEGQLEDDLAAAANRQRRDGDDAAVKELTVDPTSQAISPITISISADNSQSSTPKIDHDRSSSFGSNNLLQNQPPISPPPPPIATIPSIVRLPDPQPPVTLRRPPTGAPPPATTGVDAVVPSGDPEESSDADETLKASTVMAAPLTYPSINLAPAPPSRVTGKSGSAETSPASVTNKILSQNGKIGVCLPKQQQQTQQQQQQQDTIGLKN